MELIRLAPGCRLLPWRRAPRQPSVHAIRYFADGLTQMVANGEGTATFAEVPLLDGEPVTIHLDCGGRCERNNQPQWPSGALATISLAGRPLSTALMLLGTDFLSELIVVEAMEQTIARILAGTAGFGAYRLHEIEARPLLATICWPGPRLRRSQRNRLQRLHFTLATAFVQLAINQAGQSQAGCCSHDVIAISSWSRTRMAERDSVESTGWF